MNNVIRISSVLKMKLHRKKKLIRIGYYHQETLPSGNGQSIWGNLESAF